MSNNKRSIAFKEQRASGTENLAIYLRLHYSHKR